MAGILANFRNTIIVGLILAVIMMVMYGTGSPHGFDQAFWQSVFRWAHVFFGILWIGLLYYFNFVQIRKMPEVPAELKPAVSKYIAPEALFWFRWAALFTVLAGILLAFSRSTEYAIGVLSLGATEGFDPSYVLMGVGVWLAIIMFINVWALIWPNQKRALGIVPADDETKARSARAAMLFSRTNLLLSLPMLVSMTMQQTLFG
ncbi:MAG TPA: urate hydroxylase PuuD [Phenylobacterium sp.]